MTVEPRTSLGIIYQQMMPADAGQRLLEAARHPLAQHVTIDHVRDGLCFAAQVVVASLSVPVDANTRRKLASARTALAKYDMIMRELDASGHRPPLLPDGWVDRSISYMDAMSETRGSARRADYLRNEFYPFLLALYELGFSEVPTAYYYAREERDGPTLAFVRQAAVELDAAHSAMFARSPVAVALLGDGRNGTLSVALPQGDSLRRALEPWINARAGIKDWFVGDAKGEGDHMRRYRVAHNLLRYRVFSTRNDQ